MKLKVPKPDVNGLPRAGERVRLTDGRLARVTKITTRWETDQDEQGYGAPRFLLSELTLKPDAKPKA